MNNKLTAYDYATKPELFKDMSQEEIDAICSAQSATPTQNKIKKAMYSALGFLGFVTVAGSEISCTKSNDPTPIGTEVVNPTKSRLDIAKEEFNAQNAGLNAPNSLDHRRSNFETGYVGKLQSDQMFGDRLNELMSQGNLPNGTFTLFEFGNPELFNIVNSNYPNLLKSGVIQFKLFGPNGIYDETNSQNPQKNIFANPSIKYETTAYKHAQWVFETTFGAGTGELNLSQLQVLSEKFPVYGTSPIKIYIFCSVKESGLPYISSNDQSNEFFKNSVGNAFNIRSSSYVLAAGSPTRLIKQINANNSLLFWSLPNQNDLPARNSYVTAGVEYDQKYQNMFMVGATQSNLNPSTETSYTPATAPTILGLSGTTTSLGQDNGTSYATPRAGMQAFKTLIQSGGKLSAKNTKAFYLNSSIKTQTGEPVVDYGVSGLRAMGLIPSVIETGQSDGYLISDKFEVIDPTGKLTIEYKDGKSYIKPADVQKYSGSTVNLVAKITYGGKIYFPAVPVKIGTSTTGANITTYAVN